MVDVLDGERARAVGGLGGPQLEAHAVACSLDRGWPLVTTDPARYAVFGDVDTGQCPDPPPGRVSRAAMLCPEPDRAWSSRLLDAAGFNDAMTYIIAQQ